MAKETFPLLMFLAETVTSNHTDRKSTNIQLTTTRANLIPHLHTVRFAARRSLRTEPDVSDIIRGVRLRDRQTSR